MFKAARQLGKRDEMIVEVLVGAGLRASELCALRVDDIGITAGKCQIDVRRGKGSKQRVVFISRALADSLREFIDSRVSRSRLLFTGPGGTRLKHDHLYSRIKRIGKIASLPWLHPHCLRHTFGTMIYNVDKDLFFIKEQMGHSRLDTTQIYAKTLSASKVRQMENVSRDISRLKEKDA